MVKKSKFIFILASVFMLSIISVSAAYITTATSYLYTSAVAHDLVLASATTKVSFSANTVKQTFSSTAIGNPRISSKSNTNSLTSSNIVVGTQSIPYFPVQVKHEIINNSTYETVTNNISWPT